MLIQELKEIRRQTEADKIEAASAHVKAAQALTEDRLQEKQRLEEVILRLQEEHEKVRHKPDHILRMSCNMCELESLVEN